MNTYIGINGNKLRMKADMEEAEFPIWGDDSVSASKQTWEQYLSSLPVIEAVFEVEIDKEYTEGLDFRLYEGKTYAYNEKWGYGCADCCNGDRCDSDCQAMFKGRRKECVFCKGTGWLEEKAIVALPISKIEERERSVVDGLIAKGFPRLEEDRTEVSKVEQDAKNWNYRQWMDFVMWYSGMKEKSVEGGIRQYHNRDL